jgi:hypothetical protein
MSLWDAIDVRSPDGDTLYEEGVDYEIDYENDTIARLAGGSIPDGGAIKIRYAKGVPGDILNDLKTHGEAILRPVKALVKILSTPGDDLFEAGTDISDKTVRVEFRQSLSGRPDELEVVIVDSEIYQSCNPADKVIMGCALGAIDASGESHYVECFRGIVVQREFVTSKEGAHHVRILARDFSVSLDAPMTSAMGRTWHPTLRREVFRNGTLIADDYPSLRSSQAYDSIDFDDVIELHFAKEYPQAHQIIRDCFDAASSDFLDRLAIDCLDFPVLYMDGREKTPGQVIREIAGLAGASVRAEGMSLVISERGFPDGFSTAWIYNEAAILEQGEREVAEADFSAVQIFGHSETSRLPTKSVYLPPTDFTQPGWCRVVDEEGTLEPSEPLRSDELPQPAELTFQLDGELYDPSAVRVVGGELAGKPSVEMIDDRPVINVTVLVEWKVEDKSGECPYVEDENGIKLFRIRGRVFDAVPAQGGATLPIPHASVRRESLDGDAPGETFDVSADHEGYYLFEAVPIGKYKIIASSPGYLDNFSDDDPGNDEFRDLYEELVKYEDEIEEGRYEKEATDYHVIVWARPRIDFGPLADLTVSQVLLEVRRESTRHGEALIYGPPIRDERITTEVLARRIGKVVLAAGSDARPAVTLRLPLNRWLRAGDGVRITGDAIDLPLPASRPFQATEVRKVFEPESGAAYDIVSSAPGKAVSQLMRGLGHDPLDTRVGVVVAVYRNELGGRVYDVAAAGQILYGLKAWPSLGEVTVGEIVQVSRATSGALSYLIVARTTELFGSDRVCYV